MLKLAAKLAAMLIALAGGLYGGLVFAAGGEDSRLCQAARFVADHAAYVPVPASHCGIVLADDPYSLTPPPQPKRVEDSVFFRSPDPDRKFELPSHYRMEEVEIGPGCTFSPAAVTAKYGTYITWTNGDSRTLKLSIAAPPPYRNAGPQMQEKDIRPGESYRMFVGGKGTVTYSCLD